MSREVSRCVPYTCLRSGTLSSFTLSLRRVSAQARKTELPDHFPVMPDGTYGRIWASGSGTVDFATLNPLRIDRAVTQRNVRQSGAVIHSSPWAAKPSSIDLARSSNHSLRLSTIHDIWLNSKASLAPIMGRSSAAAKWEGEPTESDLEEEFARQDAASRARHRDIRTTVTINTKYLGQRLHRQRTREKHCGRRAGA